MQQVAQDEQTFLAEYDPSEYPSVAVTVDVAALTIKDGKLVVLLVQRDTHPFKDQWALPGSFLRPDDPYLVSAVMRAMEAKANLSISHIEQLRTYGDAERDPRMRVVSVAFVAFAPDFGYRVPGVHVRSAEWVSVDEVERRSVAFKDLNDPTAQPRSGRPMAFDHDVIVSEAVERARNKLEYTTLATGFLPEVFSIADLRRVYATVWGKAPDVANFYRKVKASKGFLHKVGHKGNADLYRAGPAQMLYPPIRREGGEWV